MPQFPQRPRPHVVEAESRTAARAVFEGAGWVVRDITPDYGLDQHVEIFDGRTATGLFFYTQLKATDEPDLNSALAATFSTSSLKYSDAVDEPVLLVRYHAPSRTLFGRWFHRVEPNATDAATRTIRFDRAVIGTETAAAFRNEVELFRRMRRTRMSWPLAIRITSVLPAIDAEDLRIACTSLGGPQRHVRYMAQENPASSEAAVDVAPDYLVVHVGVASVTMHGDMGNKAASDLAVEILFATGICLLLAGHADGGSRLVVKTAGAARLID